MLLQFRANQSGGIINVSSGGGFYGLPIISVYNACQFAFEGFTEALAFELAAHNVFVKSVVPNESVMATKFNARALAIDLAPAPAHGEFMQKTGEVYRGICMIAARGISADDVAQTIYGAATNATDTFRYMVRHDTLGFLKARQGVSEGTNDKRYAVA
ncbi:hypothetical protein B0H10DRAFT_1283770 [Mycena sp. CBHHK59/15]|nr:hypothetical protein B0H10DRAFT_1283770 [Mycena sp. CBHHK59/15]